MLFLILFVVLLLAWIFGWAVFHVAGALMHILLVLAVISLIVHFVRGSRTTTV
ncbi:MAG: lmo0937 family membrane protein [Terriglobales bacterium]